jgi:hypothetical protein
MGNGKPILISPPPAAGGALGTAGALGCVPHPVTSKAKVKIVTATLLRNFLDINSPPSFFCL